MNLFQIATVLITLSALFSYANFQYLRMPNKIGVMAIALALSLALLLAGKLGLADAREHAAEILRGIDFNETLFHGMLAFLLFAGAQNLDINALRSEKAAVVLLATVSVIVSTVVVGSAIWMVMDLIGTHADLDQALLFGALVSPTDPIAVIGIMKNAQAPKSLEVQMSGESLFNDGIGVVIFIVILELTISPAPISALHITTLFLEEAAGGLLFGLGAGYLVYSMLKRIDNFQVEILLTLMLAMAAYALAEMLPIPVSGPIAVVAAGMLVGNQGRAFAMSAETREHVDRFWELIDEILNAALFVLIGLEVLAIPWRWSFAIAGVASILITLAARWISVAGVISLLRFAQPVASGTISILTWGGLRGGISVALALSLPPMKDRDLIVAMTYIVVIFSIIVQGLTVGKLTRHFITVAASSAVEQLPLSTVKSSDEIRVTHGEEEIAQ
jgi:CPA1 family monovalent cation:H+ antiporter